MALLVLNDWLREFPLYAIANLFEFRNIKIKILEILGILRTLRYLLLFAKLDSNKKDDENS